MRSSDGDGVLGVMVSSLADMLRTRKDCGDGHWCDDDKDGEQERSRSWSINTNRRWSLSVRWWSSDAGDWGS